jgi:hypothetical protein
MDFSGLRQFSTLQCRCKVSERRLLNNIPDKRQLFLKDAFLKHRAKASLPVQVTESSPS